MRLTHALVLLAALLPAAPALASSPAGKAADWKDVRTEHLDGLDVTLSAPVLVGRRAGYLWFPTLTKLSDGRLLAVMSNYHDDHVKTATGMLSWSSDGGRSWTPLHEGFYSDAAVRLPGGDQLLLPYYLTPRPGGAMGAPYQLVRKGATKASVVEEGVTVAGWPRPDRMFAEKLGLSGFVFNGNTVERRGGGHLATLYGYFKDTKRYSLVTAASKDGVKWNVLTTIADEKCPLAGGEGPCEAATCRLKDGRLMCVFRLAANVPYGQTFSADEGKTWTPARNLEGGAASVQPALAVLEGGAVVLTGGRPGLYAWLNRAGDGKAWQRVDLRSVHDALRPDDPITNPAAGGNTSSYTEVVALDETHALVIYDRLARGWAAIPKDSRETNSVWVMRLTVRPAAKKSVPN